MCNPTSRENEKKAEELLHAPVKSPRHAIELGMELNALLGHENHGCMSFTHGFAPQLTPPPRLPPEFKAWDDLSAMLPMLWSQGRLQLYIDNEFPTLDASLLPPQFALRAAHILGITIHAYWHVGGLRAPDGGEELVPKCLERPWYYIVTKYLYREHPFMGFYEMLMAAFNYPKLIKDIEPKETHKISWHDEEKESWGMREYDPKGVRVQTLTNVVSLSGVTTEKAFFCSFAEMNCRGAPMVTHMINAQEAAARLAEMGFTTSDASFVGTEEYATLRHALTEIRSELQDFTLSFRLIHGMRASKTYVDPSVWAEAIAPVDKPFPGVKVGPSGAGMPLTITLDAFFQRSEHGNFIGKEVQKQLSLYPSNWNRFIHAIRAYTGVGAIISAGNDMELKGLFAGCLRAYAGDEGFLGVHKLKMYGYMEFTKKLARGKVKGYTGLLKQRVWTMIAGFMRDAQLERLDVPLDALSGACQVAQVIPTDNKTKIETDDSLHVRLDVKGTGIITSPGDRMGILYETDQAMVKESLQAFGRYNSMSLEELSNLPVRINDKWRTALRLRPGYHKSLGLKYDKEGQFQMPYEIPLSQFLRYAKLRPISENMVRVAYAATLNPMLLKFLETHRESMLHGPDLIHFICRSHTNATHMLLQNKSDETSDAKKTYEDIIERLFFFGDLYKDGYISRQSMVRIGRAAGLDDTAQYAVMVLFDKHDPDHTGKLDLDRFKELVMDATEITEGPLACLFSAPSLCDVFPPIDFRVYSIASSDKNMPGEVHLCVEKVHYSQKDPTALISPAFCDLAPKHERFGASSNFLKERTLSDEKTNIIIQHYRQPTFQLPPPDVKVPVLMFAAGSGVAPFRSFWQELAIRHSKAATAGTELPPKPILILQARTRDSIPFAEEMASMVGAGILDIQVTLSREDYTADFSSGKVVWVPGERGYVHKTILNGGKLRDILSYDLSKKGNGWVYMCSGEGFATSIMNAISDIIGEEGIEHVMSEERLKLEVFTSLRGPDRKIPDIKMSDFMYANDFRDLKSDKPLELAIDGLVYDMKNFALRHPGGTEILFLYCGMDASVPWEAIGHHEASEVKSLLDMYEIGRLRTADDNVQLACSTSILPLHKPEISEDFGSYTTSPDENTTTLRRYFTDAWNPTSALYMESENIVFLGYMQFWDGNAKLTSAEPDPSIGHLCTWEGETTYKRKKSVLQGQMFTASHRKLWNELMPVIFADEFLLGISALSPKGSPAILAHLRKSEDHTRTSAFVDLLEDMITEYVESDSNNGTVPAPMQALFDHVRDLDETFFAEMKPGISKIMKLFEDYESNVENLLEEVDSAVRVIAKAISDYCKSISRVANRYFDEKQVAKAMAELASSNDSGGLCRLFPYPESKSD